jgi:hypothetical protein
MKKIFLFFLVFIQCTNANSQKPSHFLQEIIADPDIQVYFSYPGRYEDPMRKNQVTEVIVDILRNTKVSLEIYAYSLNHPAVLDEIEKAYQRGVNVYIIGDSDKDYSNLVNRGIPVHIWKGNGLHHVKVIISDKKILFTGTGNFSDYGLSRDLNIYFKLAIDPNKDNFSEFMREEYKEPFLQYKDIIFINSPDQGKLIQAQILRSIEEAKFEIRYLIFDHFDPIITHALRKATARGVRVLGVYDTPADAEGKYLVENFLGLTSEISEDGNNDVVFEENGTRGGLLHHKSMVIDRSKVITGSYNYSLNARDNNREIMMFTENQYVVLELLDEFDRVYKKSKKINRKTDFVTHWSNTYPLYRNTDFCIEGEVSQPVVEVGEGIFKTYLYYSSPSTCFSYKDYVSVSSGFSGFRSEFFISQELAKSSIIYDRSSYRKADSSENSSSNNSDYPETLFTSKKKLVPIVLSDIRFSKNILSFSIQGYEPVYIQKLTLWTPGTSTVSGTQFQYSDQYSTTLNFSDKNLKEGLIFIEQKNTIGFYCYSQNGRETSRSINYFLNLYNFRNAIDKKEIETVKCYDINHGN